MFLSFMLNVSCFFRFHHQALVEVKILDTIRKKVFTLIFLYEREKKEREIDG